MFVRKSFKSAALSQLKGRWKIPVLTTLLSFAIIGILESAISFNSLSQNESDYVHFSETGFGASYNSTNLSSLVSFAVFCISIVFKIAQLSVCNTMFREEIKIHFSDFTGGLNQWWQAIRGGLLFFLWVWLWSLLFVIPGIVKAYSYSMMFFIMAENPKISVRKAMKLSKELTRGYKGELFVLDLSFLGWAILASIPCFAGWLWLLPYMNMTETNAYQYLKQVAIDSNRVAPEDFE